MTLGASQSGERSGGFSQATRKTEHPWALENVFDTLKKISRTGFCRREGDTERVMWPFAGVVCKPALPALILHRNTEFFLAPGKCPRSKFRINGLPHSFTFRFRTIVHFFYVSKKERK